MIRVKNYLVVVPILFGAVAFARLAQPYFDAISLVMVYMLAVVVVAFFLSLGPAIIACLLSVALFDFFNLPPYMQFSRSPGEYTLTLLVMLVTAATISTLAARLRQQALEADEREARTAALYELAEELAGQQASTDILAITVRHVAAAFQARVRVLYADQRPAPDDWPFERAFGPDAFLGPPLFHAEDDRIRLGLPLAIDASTRALLLVDADRTRLAHRHQRAHVQAMLRQAALAVERNTLRERIQQSELHIQHERLRNTILNAISHDLRTPLASIIGASSSLLAEGDNFSDASRQQMRIVIHEEAVQMQGMVENLLDMARLQSGAPMTLEWQAIEEIVGSALAVLRRRIHQHVLRVDVPDDLPLLRCDSVLMERVIINLVENAAKHAPKGTLITLGAGRDGNYLCLCVSDEGPGVPESLRTRIFEPFFRANPATSGFGLGLTICRGIVEAHDGHITLATGPDGHGSSISVCLPLAADTPTLEQETPWHEPS